MEFERLANVFKNLEDKSERLVKVDILSKFILEIDKDSIKETFMLIGGNIFYPWEDKDTEIAEKLTIKALSIATGYDKQYIENLFVKTGDMGLVAEKLVLEKKQRSIFTKKLSIKDVYDTFRSIGLLGGEGAQDKKIRYLANLFVSSTPLEARYIARLSLEDLKIGVGEGIIIDSIAKAFNFRSEDIEKAYFILNDFGEVVKLILEKGSEAIYNISPILGRPIKVMLAIKADSAKEAFDVVGRPAMIEYKYDGFRVQIHKKGNEISLWTRRLENVTDQFPDVIEFIKECLPMDKDFLVEGEIVGYHDRKYLPFQKISQRIRRKYNIEKMVKEIPVVVRLFDIIYYDNSLLNVPFKERRDLLKSIVKEDENKISVSEGKITDSEEEANNFFNDAIRNGLEGIMFKKLDAKYQPGRRVGYMVKLKPVKESIDVVITGAEWGEGKRGGWLTSYIISILDRETGKLLEVGEVSSGLKEKKESEDDITFEDMTKILKPLIREEDGKMVKIIPKIVIEVLYDEIQKSPKYSSGFALRFPRFVRLRPDKSIEDIDDINRLYDLYRNQKS
ncbi:DNA ligase [Nanobdella aerobiophila]|uniref:DNA ligase n=1 Tax=Nanobdella aerobiophila TaxID=2586965 RepID=A0A915SYF6_9ARCH|nr:ATP-dependent DNA ligase [Nanobdella aerobiophila]BBL45770.1 DNA ligase [Nanobdella aerobiophila]